MERSYARQMQKLGDQGINMGFWKWLYNEWELPIKVLSTIIGCSIFTIILLYGIINYPQLTLKTAILILIIGFIILLIKKRKEYKKLNM